MANHGNTGQRYKLSKLTGLEARGNKVLNKLDCGHDYESTWDTPEQAQGVVARSQSHIGKRQGCRVCTREAKE